MQYNVSKYDFNPLKSDYWESKNFEPASVKQPHHVKIPQKCAATIYFGMGLLLMHCSFL